MIRHSTFLRSALVSALACLLVIVVSESEAEEPLAVVGGLAPGEILAKLGARMEAGVSEEQRRAYEGQFDRVDGDGDGRHSETEYIEEGNYLTPQARRGIFNAADADGDRVVTKAEYLRNRIITDEAKRLVQAMDDNGDRLVQEAEFIGHATAKLGDDTAVAKAVFAALDTDGDGKIRIPEYLRVWGRWARSSADAPSPNRPNIIVIMADDLGYGDTSVYDGWVKTPHLERMAREGMTFTDFHTNSSVCSPTRAAFLTGRYQQRVGIVDVVARHLDTPGLDPSQNTLPRWLKKHGYRTALQGKWHLGTEPKFNPVHHGFDEFRGYLSGYIDYHAHEKTWHHGLEIQDQKGYSTHLITQNSARFIEENHEGPFFLLVAHEAVHLPFQTPADTVENRKPIPKSERWSRERIRPKYKIMLEEMDKGVGEILEAVRRCGVEKETLVLFFSDNGAISAGSSAPWRGGKFSHYEGGHRVPAIAWWPGKVAAGVRSEATVMAMDFFPTVLELSGLPAPPEDRPLDGLSLGGLLLGKEVDLSQRELFFGYEPKLGTAMRQGEWKMIVKGDRRELYNLESDPGEKTNLVEDFPQRAESMAEAIENWKKDVRPGT